MVYETSICGVHSYSHFLHRLPDLD